MMKQGISLCMIVKNEAHRITDCLSSITNMVNEMIVVDTGSTDDTIALAQRAGAKVFPFEWKNDTASARNFGLRKAGYEWIMVLDADEFIAESDFDKIRNNIKNKDVDGFVFSQRSYTDDSDTENWRPNDLSYPKSKPYAGFFDISVIRLFRNRPDINYTDHAHELIEKSMKDRPKKNINIPIHHFGISDGRVSSGEKDTHYLNLLLEDLRDEPNVFKTHFLLGRQYYQMNQLDKAIFHLKKATELRPSDTGAFHNLANALIKNKDYTLALEYLNQAVKINPYYEELFYCIAIAFFYLNKTDKAIEAITKFLRLNPNGVKGLNLMGYIYMKQGLLSEAEKLFQKAVAVHPRYRIAYGNLIETFIAKQEIDKAKQTAEILLSIDQQAKPWIDKILANK